MESQVGTAVLAPELQAPQDLLLYLLGAGDAHCALWPGSSPCLIHVMHTLSFGGCGSTWGHLRPQREGLQRLN